MKVQQLSVFLENKPGRLSSICNTLAVAGINLITLSLADTQQFGILRLIVEDWRQAKQLLEERGVAVNVTDVVAIEVKDEPGGLASILTLIEDAGISVEYMYAFAKQRRERAVLVFRFNQMDQAVAALRANGVTVVAPAQLFQ